MQIKDIVPHNWIRDEYENNVELWFPSTKSHHGNYNRKPFVIPRTISVDATFAEAMGLILGDGDMHRTEKRHLSFASKDIDIAAFVMNVLKTRFLLKTQDLTVAVHHGQIRPNLIMIAEKLSFPIDRLGRYNCKRNRYPAIHIQVNGIVFRLLFERIVQNFLASHFLEVKELRQGFLRGLFAAEGCVAIRYDEYFINCLSFALASKETELLSFLEHALKAEGITYKLAPQRHNCIELIISNWRNYLKCWNIRLFDRCERKKQKFLSVAKQCKVYGILPQEDLDKLWHIFLQKDLARIIGSWQGNVCKMLQGKILFSLDQIKTLEQRGISLNIQKLRVGSLTELPYSEETLKLFSAA